jgi:hypothetical protein
MPNPQPGGPVDYTGSYPVTCLAWVTLPGAYTPTSIALGVIRANKLPHPQYVLQQDGSLWGGIYFFIRFNIFFP